MPNKGSRHKEDHLMLHGRVSLETSDPKNIQKQLAGR